MKWNILIASLVMSVGLSAQSFGFELLDRMLGASGCGCDRHCCDHKPACGCEAKPACGCEAKPACGCEAKCCRQPLLDHVRCCKPACGCEAKPACGCEAKANCGCGAGILDGLFGCHSCCKKACGCEAKPACGCEAKCCQPKCCQPKCCPPKCCNNGCGHNGCGHNGCGLGILDSIFGCHSCGCRSHRGCGCEVSCDCGATAEKGDTGGDMAPMPPAPVVDPSAFVPSQQNVVRASTSVVR